MKKFIVIIASIAVLALGIAFYSLKLNPHEEDIIQSHRSYEIELIEKPDASQIVLNKPTKIRYKVKTDKGDTVKKFAVAHGKIMHFILIRKDLTQFQHLHPDFDEATGEFRTNAIFTVDGPYRFFADFIPVDDNPQKLPATVSADVAVGDIASFQPHALQTDSIVTKTVPPDYQVTYSFPTDMQSQSPFSYSLVVEQNGQPANLETYLGALGHSVALKEGTLDYIHTHAGEAANEHETGHEDHNTSSTQQYTHKMTFTTTLPEPGKYKILTQFQHNGKVHITDYTIEAR